MLLACRARSISSREAVLCAPVTGSVGERLSLSFQELGKLRETTIQLHIEAKPPSDLTRAQIEALRCLANGDRHAAAAEKLGITESAFKARLKSARIRLEARTSSEAIRKVREYRLFE